MKCAVVSSRQLSVFKRLDAHFHIWIRNLLDGMEGEDTSAFWDWLAASKLKRSALEKVLLEARDETDAVRAFEEYMRIRYIDGALSLLSGNYTTAVTGFVHRMVRDLIRKKQAEVDQQLKEMDALRTKFRIPDLGGPAKL